MLKKEHYVENDRYGASNGNKKKECKCEPVVKTARHIQKHDIRSVSYVIHIGYIILENGQRALNIGNNETVDCSERRKIPNTLHKLNLI